METMRVMDDEICYRAKDCQYLAKFIYQISIGFLFSAANGCLLSRSHCPQVICYSSWFVSNSLYTSKSKGIEQIFYWASQFFFIFITFFSFSQFYWLVRLWKWFYLKWITFVGHRAYGGWCPGESKRLSRHCLSHWGSLPILEGFENQFSKFGFTFSWLPDS